jgi:hypothetical protein
MRRAMLVLGTVAAIQATPLLSAHAREHSDTRPAEAVRDALVGAVTGGASAIGAGLGVFFSPSTAHAPAPTPAERQEMERVQRERSRQGQ